MKTCLPFRGHCEDSKYHPKVGEYSIGGVGVVGVVSFLVDKLLDFHGTCLVSPSPFKV